MATLYPTPLEKVVARTKLSPHRFVIAVGAILTVLLLIATLLDDAVQDVLFGGAWRVLLLAPVIIIYILVLSGPMSQYRAEAVEAFRQMVLIDDRAFEKLVQEASDVDDRAELIAFLAGAALGVWSFGPWDFSEDFLWLKAYLVVVDALMFGLIAWIAFTSVAGTKLDAVLHQQALDIDVFDLEPFYPIGRYSLLASLAFVGGSVISVLFISPLQGAFNAAALGFYGILGLVSLLVFFLGTRHTHRVLKNAKAQEQWEVHQNIVDALRALKDPDRDIGALSTELNLWLKYEERLKNARTWPYNTAMLRTLFVSVLFPIIASQAQRILSNLLSN